MDVPSVTVWFQRTIRAAEYTSAGTILAKP
jgi:hypothetical protein